MSFISTVPPLCLSCAYYTSREQACSKFIVGISKNISEPHFEKAASVRLDSHRCGPEGKLYVSKIGLQVINVNVDINLNSEEHWN